MNDINIERSLEVLPNNKLIVPGCEPTSAVTSVTLTRQSRCGNSIVNLADALAAIPGSRVELLSNFGAGPRKKLFILPPFNQDCDPCPIETDWYEVLRLLAVEETPVTEQFDACHVLGMGQCPSPDFENFTPPPKSTYFPEGTDILHRAYTP